MTQTRSGDDIRGRMSRFKEVTHSDLIDEKIDASQWLDQPVPALSKLLYILLPLSCVTI